MARARVSGVWCRVTSSHHQHRPYGGDMWWCVVCGVMVDNVVQFFVPYVLACDCENIEELRNMVTWMCHIILKHTLRAIICNYMQYSSSILIPFLSLRRNVMDGYGLMVLMVIRMSIVHMIMNENHRSCTDYIVT